MISPYLSIPLLSLALFGSMAMTVEAHSVVRPNKATVGAYQTFTLSVPSERNSTTTLVRLVIPEGLQSVTPNVKPGWKLEIKRTNVTTVTELVWSNGTIPMHQRDEFSFSVKAPVQETTVNWKAYQTYQDGTVSAWDMDPSIGHTNHDDHSGGPASQTTFIAMAEASASPTSTTPIPSNDHSSLAVIALVLSIIALTQAMANRSKSTTTTS